MKLRLSSTEIEKLLHFIDGLNQLSNENDIWVDGAPELQLPNGERVVLDFAESEYSVEMGNES